MFTEFLQNYSIDKQGNVYSKKHKNKDGLPKQLKPWIDKYGYECYTLTAETRKKQNIFKHRLVLWINEIKPQNKYQTFVNHIDGNRLNNSIDNLEWCTRQENERHKYSTLQHRRLTLRKFTVEQVKQMRKEYQPNTRGRGFSIRGLAQKYGCATTTMRDILQYRTYNKDKDLE